MQATDGINRQRINLGRPGETAQTFVENGQLDEVRQELRLAKAASAKSVLILSLGGNDLLGLDDTVLQEREAQLKTAREFLGRALTEIVATAGENAEIVLINYYDPTEGDPELRFSDSWWIARFNDMISEVAAIHSVRVADVHAEFGGRAAELTRFPSEVHPTNQGYRAIARAVLGAIDFELAAPEVTVEAPDVIRRDTPTIRFRVDGAIEPQSVSVEADDGMTYSPIPLGDGSYVVLIDLSGAASQTVEIEIAVQDVTGARTEIRRQLDSE